MFAILIRPKRGRKCLSRFDWYAASVVGSRCWAAGAIEPRDVGGKRDLAPGAVGGDATFGLFLQPVCGSLRVPLGGVAAAHHLAAVRGDRAYQRTAPEDVTRRCAYAIG